MAEVSNKCVNIQGETDGVVKWIKKVRVQKRELKKRVTKNLRVEAILNSTLGKSVSLLRARQQQRQLERFELLKERALCKRAEITSCCVWPTGTPIPKLK
jgi:hypothetical protein